MKKKPSKQPNTAQTAEQNSKRPQKNKTPEAAPTAESELRPSVEQPTATPPLPKQVEKFIEQLGLKPFLDNLNARFTKMEQNQETYEKVLLNLATQLQAKGLIQSDQQMTQQPQAAPAAAATQPSNPANQQPPQQQAKTGAQQLVDTLVQLGPGVAQALIGPAEPPKWMQDFISASLANSLQMQASNINLTNLITTVLTKQLGAAPSAATVQATTGAVP